MNLGERKTAEAMELRAQVYTYLEDNLGVRVIQIAINFGISPQTAGRHVRAIREGWKPEAIAAAGSENG